MHRLLKDGSPSSSVALAPFDSDSEEVAALALKCLGHLFTWIPLAGNLIEPRLLGVVFQFAALGAQPESVRKHESSMKDRCKNQAGLCFQTHADRVNPCYSNLGILAMTAVNEIVYKNCVPQDLESFLLSMFNNAFQLMQAVVQEPA